MSEAPAFPFADPSLPLEARVEDLHGRLTLEEKVARSLLSLDGVSGMSTMLPLYNIM